MALTRIRRRLLLVATVAIVPLAVLAAVAIEALLAQQRSQAEQSALNLTRALATAVDNELRLTVSSLQSLALTEPFGAGSDDGLTQARALATSALAARPEWRSVLLGLPTGEVLLNTGLPVGTAPPRTHDRASLAEVARSGEPAVGSLTAGSLGNRGIPVRVPVMRDGTLRYVLTAIVKPEAIAAVISRPRVPADWIVSVFDADNVRVARSSDHERLLGTRPNPTLVQLMSTVNGNGEAYGPTTTIDGSIVNTAVARLTSARWTVALGVPRSASEEAIRRSVLVFGGGLLLSIALGVLLALVVSRRIESAILRLRDVSCLCRRCLDRQDR